MADGNGAIVHQLIAYPLAINGLPPPILACIHPDMGMHSIASTIYEMLYITYTLGHHWVRVVYCLVEFPKDMLAPIVPWVGICWLKQRPACVCDIFLCSYYWAWIVFYLLVFPTCA